MRDKHFEKIQTHARVLNSVEMLLIYSYQITEDMTRRPTNRHISILAVSVLWVIIRCNAIS